MADAIDIFGTAPRFLFFGTFYLILLSTGLLLATAKPRNRVRWLLASLFLALFAKQLAGLWEFSGDLSAQDARTSMYVAYNLGMAYLVNVVMFAVFRVYPHPVRLRSAHGLVLLVVGAVLVAGGLLWIWRPDALVVGWSDPGYVAVSEVVTTRPTLLLYAAFIPSTTLLVLAQGSALVRARRMSAAERGVATTLVLALYAGPFLSVGGLIGYNLELAVAGRGPSAYFEAYIAGLPGACCGLGWLYIAALRGVPLAIAGYMSVRHRHHLGSALVLLGIANRQLPHEWGFGFFEYTLMVTAFVTLFMIAHRDALGGTDAPRAFNVLLAVGVGSITFLLVFTSLLHLIPEAELWSSMALIASVPLAVGAAVAVVPPWRVRVWRTLRGFASHDDHRAAAYRVAMVSLIGEGYSGQDLSDRLRSMRSELGISEKEHAVMEYVLRANPVGAGDASPSPGSRHAPPAAGQRLLDRFVVEAVVATGPGGDTMRCRDIQLERDVLVHRVRPTDGTVAAVEQAAHAFAAVDHPGLPTVYEVEPTGRDVLLVLEDVKARALAELLEQEALSAQDLVRLLSEVLQALDALHANGIVHDRVTPDNILVTKDGHFRLGVPALARDPWMDATAATLGALAGPSGPDRHVSPEAASGGPTDARSDLYGVASCALAALGRDDGSNALRAVLEKALSRDRTDRYASAAEMLEAVRRAR